MELGVKFAYNKNVMRPLYHPSVDEITVQGILYALSDPVRVRILMELAGAECSKRSSDKQFRQEPCICPAHLILPHLAGISPPQPSSGHRRRPALFLARLLI